QALGHWRGIYRLQRLHAKLQHVLHFQRLVTKERLTVRPADERAVVGRLHADQLVQILTGGIDLAGCPGPVELRGVAADRLHLHVEGGRDIHHERRLHGIFAVRERIQNLEGPVGIARAAVLGEPGQVAGVAPQLGGDAMVRVPADGEGQNHDARAGRPHELDHAGARRSQAGPPAGSQPASVLCGRRPGKGKGALPRPLTLPRPFPGHSYLSASTGSSPAARLAGTIPKTTPTRMETRVATAALHSGTVVEKRSSDLRTSPAARPNTMPITPP